MTVSKSYRLLAFVVVVLALAAGLLLLGRVSDDATVSMGLTALWFGLVFVAGAVLVLRRRELFWPFALGYGVAAVAAAVLVIAPTLIDKEVDEQIVTGAPPAAAGSEAGRSPDEPAPEPRGNVQIATGRFGSLAHQSRGRAAVVELPGGKRKLTLGDFETDPGPDLRVYVTTSDPANGDLGDFRDLGALKGNVGNQQYDLSRGIDLRRYSTVVVWCRAFSVAFTSAPLRRA